MPRLVVLAESECLTLEDQGVQRNLSAATSVILEEPVATACAWDREYRKRSSFVAIVFSNIERQYIKLVQFVFQETLQLDVICIFGHLAARD